MKKIAYSFAALTLASMLAACVSGKPTTQPAVFTVHPNASGVAAGATTNTSPSGETPPTAVGSGSTTGSASASSGTSAGTPPIAAAPPAAVKPPATVVPPTSTGVSSGSSTGTHPPDAGGGTGGVAPGRVIVACPASTYVQVERLARPAINEGLVRSNANLNAFNSIPPSLDLQGSNTAVAAVQNDAITTLKALGNTNANDRHNTPVFLGGVVTVNALVGAVLPDVMRNDMTKASGYGAHLGFQSTPDTGRKLTDDVIDVTLNLIVPDETNTAYTGMGLVVRTDNVAYTDNYPGTTTRIHAPVTANFPFLPNPN
jgi:hypothetical protein